MATSLSQRVATSEWERRVADAIADLEFCDLWSFDVATGGAADTLTSGLTVIDIGSAAFTAHAGSVDENSSGGVELGAGALGKKIEIHWNASGELTSGSDRDGVKSLMEYRLDSGTWTAVPNEPEGAFAYVRNTTVDRWTCSGIGFVDASAASTKVELRVRAQLLDGTSTTTARNWNGVARIIA